MKCQGTTHIILIHRLGIMNVCTNEKQSNIPNTEVELNQACDHGLSQ